MLGGTFSGFVLPDLLRTYVNIYNYVNIYIYTLMESTISLLVCSAYAEPATVWQLELA